MVTKDWYCITVKIQAYPGMLNRSLQHIFIYKCKASIMRESECEADSDVIAAVCSHHHGPCSDVGSLIQAHRMVLLTNVQSVPEGGYVLAWETGA